MGTRLNGYKRLLQKYEADVTHGVLTETRTEDKTANQQILRIHNSV